MHHAEYGHGPEPLTGHERARLRSTVDAAALERFLTVTAGEVRRALVAHFAAEVTEDDVLAAYRECGATPEEIRAMAREFAAPLPGPGPVRQPPPGAPPEALAVAVVPTRQPVVSMMPPDDPALAVLWAAIEPGLAAGGAEQPG